MKSFLKWILFFLSLFCFAEDYRFSGESSFTVMREGEEETRIEGNVVIDSSERRIEADRINIQGKEERIFEGYGNVRILDYNRDMLLKSESFVYDEKKSLLKVEGNASLEDRQNEILVKSTMLNFFQNEEIALMQINVRIFKDDIICRSEYAQYKREEEILELSGAPIVYKGDDRYEADRIVVNLENDEITMFGEITGSMTTGDEKAGNENDR